MDPVVRQLHQQSRSNVPPMLFNLAAVAALIFSLASGWPTASPVWIAALTLVLAYFQHCWTTIFHEDAHYTMYPDPNARWHNVLNGTIVGTLLLLPFSIYRQAHIRHHSKMNTPEDWELWPYNDPRRSLTYRRLFAIADVFIGAWLAPAIYARIFFSKNSPITDRAVRSQVWIEYGIIVLFWGALLGMVAYYGWWWQFTLAYVIPAWVTGIIQTVRKFVDHLGLPAGHAMAGARTVLSESAPGKAIDWTSFHIAAHGLHHRYPQMPHENLEKAFEIATAEAAGLDQPIFRTHWDAFTDMLPHLAYPGIGVNARTIVRNAPDRNIEPQRLEHEAKAG